MKKIITNKTFNYKFTALKSLIFLLVFYAIGPQNLVWAQGEFVLHVVAPQATDPAIDRALDDHLAWLDPTAPTNHKLFVFLPGFSLTPSDYQLVPQEAARLGYHVIGLMYVNSVFLAGACDGSPDPNSCFEDAQFEIVYGNGLGIDSPIVDVNQPNSIINRLTKLLQYLDANDPTEGWAEFLADGAPKWSKIAVGGHSQGGSAAVMIAKYHVVDRVVMISAVTDAATNWVLTHVTPSARYWGLAHEEEFYLPAVHDVAVTKRGAARSCCAHAPHRGAATKHTKNTERKPDRIYRILQDQNIRSILLILSTDLKSGTGFPLFLRS
jgi:hypothetical protein